MELNTKQKRFVVEYLVDLNATQAAIRTGYSKKTAGEQASRLLADVRISEAVAKAQHEAQERIEYTSDQWRRDVMRIATDAEQNGDITNALKGRDMLGKSLGIYSEKRDITSSDGSMTPTSIIIKAPDDTSDN